MGSDDEADSERPCSVCGEDVIGTEFLSVDAWQFWAAGIPGEQTYLTCPQMDSGETAEYLHSHCAPLYVEMQFARARIEAEAAASRIDEGDDDEPETEDVVVRHCTACGEPVGAQPWILLNRFGLGTGKARCMTQLENEDGDYLWDQHRDIATGAVLHWPDCAFQFVEAKMVAVDFTASRDVDSEE